MTKLPSVSSDELSECYGNGVSTMLRNGAREVMWLSIVLMKRDRNDLWSFRRERISPAERLMQSFNKLGCHKKNFFEWSNS